MQNAIDRTMSDLSDQGLIEQGDIAIVCWTKKGSNRRNIKLAAGGLFLLALVIIFVGAMVGVYFGMAGFTITAIISVAIYILWVYVKLNPGRNYHIIAMNKDRLRIFDINGETGEYTQVYFTLKKEELTKASIGNVPSISFIFHFYCKYIHFSYLILLKTPIAQFCYSVYTNFFDYRQEEKVNKFYDKFFKSYYSVSNNLL